MAGRHGDRGGGKEQEAWRCSYGAFSDGSAFRASLRAFGTIADM